jgi:ABC-type uncharacterized transport system auxiliary subunit
MKITILNLAQRLCLVVASISLAGCSIIGAKPRPEPEAYLLALGDLPPGASSSISPRSPITARVALEQEGSGPVSAGSRILFITPRNTLGTYQFAKWAESPGNVFHRALLESLGSEGWLAEITSSSGLVATNTLVRFRLDAFWLDQDARGSGDDNSHSAAAPPTSGASVKPTARAGITITVIDLEGRRTIGRQSFDEAVPVTEPSAEATVVGLTTAGRSLIRRSTEWLYDTLAEYEREGRRGKK